MTYKLIQWLSHKPVETLVHIYLLFFRSHRCVCECVCVPVCLYACCVSNSAQAFVLSAVLFKASGPNRQLWVCERLHARYTSVSQQNFIQTNYISHHHHRCCHRRHRRRHHCLCHYYPPQHHHHSILLRIHFYSFIVLELQFEVIFCSFSLSSFIGAALKLELTHLHTDKLSFESPTEIKSLKVNFNWSANRSSTSWMSVRMHEHSVLFCVTYLLRPF